MTGDCILHRTHHTMGQECWRAVLEWQETAVAAGQSATPDDYKATYERALLADLAEEDVEPSSVVWVTPAADHDPEFAPRVPYEEGD